ncbi:hypothetical protein PBY51_004923 [Eleginops maclovinus]|uniref:Secreted protein n=1 Tax=Eleginops maclovinus TaxID=56733 RepID=A0AAN7X698_ELEMC|nr:hypothetical protein PBY51_004923 [Eleginops maclovinus]
MCTTPALLPLMFVELQLCEGLLVLCAWDGGLHVSERNHFSVPVGGEHGSGDVAGSLIGWKEVDGSRPKNIP